MGVFFDCDDFKLSISKQIFAKNQQKPPTLNTRPNA